MVATILQREYNLHLLSLRKYLGGVMQIAQHSDLDLGVVFKLGVLGWRGQGLPFIKNISLGLRH